MAFIMLIISFLAFLCAGYQKDIPNVAIKERLAHKRKKSGDITTTYTHTYASSSVMTAKILNEVAIGNIDPNNLFGNLICNKEV